MAENVLFKLQIDAKNIDDAIRKIKQQLDDLKNRPIKIDIDTKTPLEGIKKLETYLKSLQSIQRSGIDTKTVDAGSNSFMKLAGAVGLGMGAYQAFMEVGRKVIDFFKESIASAIEDEKQNTRLYNALNKNSLAYADMLEFKERNFRTTTFSEEDINSAISMSLQLGRTTDQTKKMVIAAEGLSKATGQDLQAILMQLSATLEGNKGRLGKLSVEIKNMSEAQLKNGEAIDIIAEKFGKFATGGITTASGAITKFKKSVEELQDTIGYRFISSISTFYIEITKLVDGLTDLLKIPTSEKFVKDKESIDVLVKSIITLNENDKLRKEQLEKLIATYPEYFGSLNAEKVKNEELIQTLGSINSLFEHRIELMRQSEKLGTLAKEENEALDQKEKILQTIITSYEKLTGKKVLDLPANLKEFEKVNLMLNDISKSAGETRKSFDNMGRTVYTTVSGMDISKGFKNSYYEVQGILGRIGNDVKKVVGEVKQTPIEIKVEESTKKFETGTIQIKKSVVAEYKKLSEDAAKAYRDGLKDKLPKAELDTLFEKFRLYGDAYEKFKNSLPSLTPKVDKNVLENAQALLKQLYEQADKNNQDILKLQTDAYNDNVEAKKLENEEILKLLNQDIQNQKYSLEDSVRLTNQTYDQKKKINDDEYDYKIQKNQDEIDKLLQQDLAYLVLYGTENENAAAKINQLRAEQTRLHKEKNNKDTEIDEQRGKDVVKIYTTTSYEVKKVTDKPYNFKMGVELDKNIEQRFKEQAVRIKEIVFHAGLEAGSKEAEALTKSFEDGFRKEAELIKEHVIEFKDGSKELITSFGLIDMSLSFKDQLQEVERLGILLGKSKTEILDIQALVRNINYDYSYFNKIPLPVDFIDNFREAAKKAREDADELLKTTDLIRKPTDKEIKIQLKFDLSTLQHERQDIINKIIDLYARINKAMDDSSLTEEMKKETVTNLTTELYAQTEALNKNAYAIVDNAKKQKDSLGDMGQIINNWKRSWSEVKGEVIDNSIFGTIDLIGKALTSMVDAQLKAVEIMTENSLNALQEQYDASMQENDDLLKYNLITKAQYNKRQEELEKQKREKEKEIRKQQYEAEKSQALVNIIIDTAVSVMQGYAEGGPILGSVLAALAIAAGAIEYSAVENAPEPEFGTGGKVEGKSHSDGGVKIEAEGGEYIIKKEVVSKPGVLQTLEKINEGDETIIKNIKSNTNQENIIKSLTTSNNEIKKFAKGGYISTTYFNNSYLNDSYLDKSYSLKYAAGGYIPDVSNIYKELNKNSTIINNNTTTLDINELKNIIKDVVSIPVNVVETDITRTQRKVSVIERKSSW